jgi:two-component system, NtrC family, response regulator AtoC
VKTLLLVDDEEDILRLLGEFFRGRGYQTALARNGIEALASVKSIDPGAVFLDLKMPDMDGAEALRLIREINPDLPVVIVSGYATEDVARELLKAGAFDFVAKPIDLQHLGEVAKQLEEVLQSRSADSPSECDS